MLIAIAFTLIIGTVLFLIAGLINPSWALFWMHEPNRILVIFIATILLMGSLTFYGEALKRMSESAELSNVQQIKAEKTTELGNDS